MLSSITKKTVMAISGGLLGLFLIIHAIGNATIYGGTHLFLSYAEHLHSLGPLVLVFELWLMFFFLVHIFFATLTFWENYRARPQRYFVNKSSGGRTFGSRTMPYTGCITLIFLIIHLSGFRFTDGSLSISEIVRRSMQTPSIAFFYIFSLGAVTLHISHGFWSIFQTLGWNKPQVDIKIRRVALVVSLLLGFIFIGIPLSALLWDQFLVS